MKSDKINTVFRMHPDHINKVFGGQSGKVTLIMNDAVIDGNRTDHNRTFTGQFAAEGLGISMAGKIHDGFSTQFHSAHYFLHLNIIVFTVTGNTEIDIDFCAEHTSHTFRA